MEIMFWLILMAVLVLIEIGTLGLTTIWFAGGSLVAAVFAMFGLPIWLQVAMFLAISLVLLFFTRPIAVQYFNRDRLKTNVEGLIGKQAMVCEDINNMLGTGHAIVNGQEWTARSSDDSVVIANGSIVEVTGVTGAKILVKPAKIKTAEPATVVSENAQEA